MLCEKEVKIDFCYDFGMGMKKNQVSPFFDARAEEMCVGQRIIMGNLLFFSIHFLLGLNKDNHTFSSYVLLVQKNYLHAQIG